LLFFGGETLLFAFLQSKRQLFQVGQEGDQGLVEILLSLQLEDRPR
jgi:hypothetical protein